MKGDVPIPYIIALLLGIVVLALLGYWFYTIYIRGSTKLTEEECRIKFQQNCESWKNLGFPNYMETKVKCDDNGALMLAAATNKNCKDTPCACDCQCPLGSTGCKVCGGNWIDVTLPVDQWWKFIAPNCKDDFGIDIQDCKR